MKTFLAFTLLLFGSICSADIKFSALTLNSASSVNVNDSFPYVNSSLGSNARLKLSDLINIPAFTTTYAPLSSPTFSGTVTATTFAGALSGNATNITATSNSSLTTLSSLSLPASQLTGTLPAGRFPALTGDLTTTAGSLATTLATVNSNVGSFTAANITVNAKGLITAAANGSSSYSGFAAHLSTNTATSPEIIIYDVADYNVGSQYSTSTGYWTVPLTGKWSITMCIGYAAQTVSAAKFNMWGITTTAESAFLIVGEAVIPAISSSSLSGFCGTNVFLLTSSSVYLFIDGSNRLTTWAGGSTTANNLGTAVTYVSASFLGS